MPDPWSVVSTKPAGNMPPSLATASDPWAVVSHQPSSAPEGGFDPQAAAERPIAYGYERAGSVLKETGKDLLGAVGGMADMFSGSPVTAPLKLGAGMAQGHMQAYQDAKDAAQQGNIPKAMFKSVAAGVPIVGPMASDIYDDAEAGNNERALGKGISRGLQIVAPEIAPRLIAPRGITADVSTPLDYTAPPRGITSSLRNTTSKATGFLSDVVDPEITGILSPRLAHIQKLMGRISEATKVDPQLALFNSTPKLGESSLFSTAADPLMPASLKPEEPAPAPYRLRGNQIQDATTVTPKQIIGPERQLAPAPDVPAPAPRGITQRKVPYVPGAAMEPAPFLTMHGAESGETAALMQLTHTGGQALRRIAQARGLKIPAAADNVSIIQKIHDDLSPEEIQSFGDAANARAQERATSLQGVDPAIVNDNRAIAQKLYSKADEMQAAGESPYKIRAWRTAGESIETRPTPVKDILGNVDALKTIRGVDSRMAQHIQEVTGSAQPVIATVPQVAPAGKPPQAAPATAVPQRGITQPVSPVQPEGVMTNESDLVSQMQRQIEANKVKRGITQPQAAVADRRLNPAQRQKVADMSPEERAQALLTSDKTGLPNRRAFDEAEPAQAVAMSDADGLKALNDKYGYEAGDAMLKAKADALKEAGIEAYHDKGDEFLYRGDSPADLQAKLDKARETLRNKTISVEMHDGRVLKFKGADFSYGTGQDLSTAETGLKANKAQREAAGQRARGQLRGITIVK